MEQIHLKQSITVSGAEVDTLHLRKPVIRDLQAVEENLDGKQPLTLVIKLIALLSNNTEDDIAGLSLDDLNTIQEWLNKNMGKQSHALRS